MVSGHGTASRLVSSGESCARRIGEARVARRAWRPSGSAAATCTVLVEHVAQSAVCWLCEQFLHDA
eukprot:scaffold144884_cov133-Phaeocystis_antarctica.AAC.1